MTGWPRMPLAKRAARKESGVRIPDIALEKRVTFSMFFLSKKVSCCQRVKRMRSLRVITRTHYPE